MGRVAAYLGQGIVYGLIAVALGYFSILPTYRVFPNDKAMILVSFAHVGDRKEACRRLTKEEIAKVAENMRRAEVCKRERVPLVVELEVSGRKMFSGVLRPTGLSSDGASHMYEKIEVSPGHHVIEARLRDSTRAEGFDYVGMAEVDLAPGARFVVDFRSELGGFMFGSRSAPSADN